MFSYTNSDKNLASREGWTLLVPSVSVANVAQLTVDLIIQNLKAQKIAEVWHPSIVPLISAKGSFDFDQDTTTACQLFVSEEKKLFILQIRTPLTAALIDGFFQEIITFIKTNKVSKLVLLTSLYSFEQKTLIGQNLCEFMQNEIFKKENSYPLENDWKIRGEDENVFGKGFALRLFKEVTKEQISCVNFMIYVNEGDNTIESEFFLKKINSYLKLLAVSENGKMNVKFPCSWKYLFGTENNVDVY